VTFIFCNLPPFDIYPFLIADFEPSLLLSAKWIKRKYLLKLHLDFKQNFSLTTSLKTVFQEVFVTRVDLPPPPFRVSRIFWMAPWVKRVSISTWKKWCCHCAFYGNVFVIEIIAELMHTFQIKKTKIQSLNAKNNIFHR
jgi:hypothetical protein